MKELNASGLFIYLRIVKDQWYKMLFLIKIDISVSIDILITCLTSFLRYNERNFKFSTKVFFKLNTFDEYAKTLLLQLPEEIRKKWFSPTFSKLSFSVTWGAFSFLFCFNYYFSFFANNGAFENDNPEALYPFDNKYWVFTYLFFCIIPVQHV